MKSDDILGSEANVEAYYTTPKVEPRLFRTFNTAQDARTYRHENGTGGWIFVPENGLPVVLFPPDMCPTAILHHPLTRGLAGELIGSA